MKLFLVFGSMFLFLWGGMEGFQQIAKVNSVKAKAEAAFLSEDYPEAVRWYVYLKNELHQNDPEISLNLAHAYFMQQDSAAKLHYQDLLQSDNKALLSVAFQQLALLKVGTGNDKKALEAAAQLSKQALRYDPTNEEARYNYELIQRILDLQSQQQQEQEDQNQEQEQDQQQEEQEQKQQDKEQQEQQEGQDNKEQNGDPQEEGQEGKENQAGDKSEEEKQQAREQQINQKLQQLNISRQKAEQILEAMRNQEMQYIQQNRKRPQNPNPNNLPDW
ncbi:MAG: hypothetical protein ACFCUI_10310 [Bernardetiaceae bacterium]